MAKKPVTDDACPGLCKAGATRRDAANFIQPWWRVAASSPNGRVMGCGGHPMQYHGGNKVWLNR